MKLVIAQSNLTLYGGAERVLLKIAQHYNAKIYTAEYNKKTTFPEFEDLDIEVVGNNSIKKIIPYGRVMQGLNYGLTFYNFKIKEDYDVINAHMSPSHWIRNKNERVLWYCHTPMRDIYDLYEFRLALKKWHQKPVYALGAKGVKLIDSQVVKKIEFIFANSANTKSRILKYYKRDSEVLNGGIDYESYKNSGDEKYFFYPSRISPNKRQDYAITAFEKFKRRKKGYKLVISGALSKDLLFQSYYEKIKRMAEKTRDVKILINVSEEMQKELFSKATAVLYPPINEDYGLVPLEAMASSKPVIAVNEGGPKDTIINNKTGFLVNNTEEMADKMLFIAEHKSIASDIGKEGLKRVKKYYSWKKFFETFDEKVRKIVKS